MAKATRTGKSTKFDQLVLKVQKALAKRGIKADKKVVADAMAEVEPQGYGSCGISGCICPGFMGGGNLCSNCGHNYSYH